jgi:hypothetical protein
MPGEVKQKTASILVRKNRPEIFFSIKRALLDLINPIVE